MAVESMGNGNTAKAFAILIAVLSALLGVYAQNANDLQQEQIKNIKSGMERIELDIKDHRTTIGHADTIEKLSRLRGDVDYLKEKVKELRSKK